jgi:hypothetical protein
MLRFEILRGCLPSTSSFASSRGYPRTTTHATRIAARRHRRMRMGEVLKTSPGTSTLRETSANFFLNKTNYSEEPQGSGEGYGRSIVLRGVNMQQTWGSRKNLDNLEYKYRNDLTMSFKVQKKQRMGIFGRRISKRLSFRIKE